MKHLLLSFALALCYLMSHAQNCGTTNIALNKPVVVKAERTWHEGSSAVDASGDTWWQDADSTGDDSYIYVDFGQSYNLCQVLICWGGNGRAANYELQTSTDASHWTTIKTVTGNVDTCNSLSVSGSGRYLKIHMSLRVYNWAQYEIFKWEVYNLLNQPPVVSITSPANNQNFTAGSNIVITANASDEDGTISKVEFYAGSILLGTATTAPYSITWPNVYDDSYTLTAKAYDNGNAATTSSPVNIAVLPDPPGWTLTGNAGTTPGTDFIGTTDSKKLILKTNNISRMAILAGGAVCIGSDSVANAEAKLSVRGAIYANKLKITQSTWADHVFTKGYKLRKLSEVEAYIQQHGHLPDVPSASQVIEQPLDVSETQTTLLKKIEELTLYTIEQEKRLQKLERVVRQQQHQLNGHSRHVHSKK